MSTRGTFLGAGVTRDTRRMGFQIEKINYPDNIGNIRSQSAIAIGLSLFGTAQGILAQIEEVNQSYYVRYVRILFIRTVDIAGRTDTTSGRNYFDIINIPTFAGA
jgi:hypothetical protein